MAHLSDQSWDVIVIGAGMSGLGAGIRLALAGQKVLLLEKHNSVGGLNGYYFRDGIKYDVGLHAMTNFVNKGSKKSPLMKLCRQLRLSYDDLQLTEQIRSCIHFPDVQLFFSNHFELLSEEIAEKFPSQVDAFKRLVAAVLAVEDTSLTENSFISTRALLRDFIPDPVLSEILLTPLLYYGSAHVNDIDWRQFAILFKAIYLEGFARPRGGVRTLLNLSREHYRQLGGALRVKAAVEFVEANQSGVNVHLLSGEILHASSVLSSIGYAETMRLCGQNQKLNGPRLSFMETITTLRGAPAEHHLKNTIVFYNDSMHMHYEAPEDYADLRSGVICVPENYEDGCLHDCTTLRTTHLANYLYWKRLSKNAYAEMKRVFLEQSRQRVFSLFGQAQEPVIIAEDIFTPLTVERYTGHMDGAIYGSPDKIRNGDIGIPNVFICGTDQGFLGIVGALLSGISMANYHVIQPNV